MTRQHKAAMLSVLFLSGVLAIGLGGRPQTHSYTRGTQQITDVCIGLASSPAYTSHREEPIGGAMAALDRRDERVVVIMDDHWNWLSLSSLLVFFGIGAITGSLTMLVRMRKQQEHPHDQA